jgi:hypothetical protein
MAEQIDLSPNPKSHIKTLSRIGYTLNSGVSDIIDNSITAEAKNICVEIELPEEGARLKILDDGFGMSLETLVDSMRIGCKDPADFRHELDLGRFGSGMKMASFSQARKLTVISRVQGGKLNSATWDLELVESENAWLLIKNSDEETELLCENLNINILNHGTAVVWENITKYQNLPHNELEGLVSQDLSSLKNYVQLHFHKFMEGSTAVDFYFNSQKLDPFDPFLRNRNGYQEGPSQNFRVKKGGKIQLKVHILPHESKLSTEDLDQLGGVDQITAKQGLYVYRSNRLIIAGGWFGLTRLSQLGKLARVEVNVPTTLDDEWSTDVKKSNLEIPHKVKQKLKQLIREPINRSRKTYKYRGKLEEANAFWQVNENERNGSVSYEISKENNILRQLVGDLNQAEAALLIDYLKHLSEEIPLHHIYEKMSSEPNSIDQTNLDYNQLLSEFNKLCSH